MCRRPGGESVSIARPAGATPPAGRRAAAKRPSISSSQRPHHRRHRLALVRADVGIRDGRIAAIGTSGQGAGETRASMRAGMVVAPGFIDMLGQSELTILVDPRLPSKIFQGITTEITGEGNSAAPMNGIARDEGGPGATTTTGSSRTGGRSASTSRASRGRAWASTWPPTSARPRCARW